MMKRVFLLSLLFLGALVAHAYEYHLQFTPASGAQGLVVAGYSISGSTITGNCSYYTSRSSGGRGGHSIITHYYNVCTWDLYGNLTSITPKPSAIAVPPVLSTSGSEVIYAVAGSTKTGSDTRGFGFSSTPSAHYSWETPNGGYAVISYSNYVFTASLISDGDFPLVIDQATVQANTSGYYTPSPGTATITGNSCGSSLPVNSTCTLTITYNPQTISCTGSPYGYAYTNVDLALVTDAGANPGFSQGFTITGVPICDD
ncbi:MAG TPA: hypothetical protein VGD64_01675 [Acidisarcina sp.]